MTEQNSDNTTLPQRTDRNAGRNRRRQRLLSAQDWCQQVTLENPRYRFRIQSGLQDGSLHPSIEKAILDLGYGRPQTLDKRLLDALGATHRGLFTLLLRKPLTEDPLAEPKQVGAGTTIEQPPQEPPAALPLRQSIVPPARPKRTQGKAQLGSNEEELR